MAQPESAFYQRIIELLDQGKQFMICRVVKAVGSAPRNAGAQMLVFPDGSIEFTLGGGAVEGRVIREAALALDANKSFFKDYHLGDLGMHCGGIMKVQAEPASANDHAFYRQAAQLIENRIPFIGCYHAKGTKVIFSSTGELFGDEYLIAKLSDAVKEMCYQNKMSAWTGTSFIHKAFPSLRLLIFGAGHVGEKLAEVAVASGVFQVDIVDDRDEFADEEKLSFCESVSVAAHNYLGDLPFPDKRTFVAVITRCHATDKVVLQTLLESEKPFAYLGMIGSVPKRAQLFKILKDEGISQEKLDQITTPMGLPIGGKDPGEIAISMLAEMIQRKNELDGTLKGGNIRWNQALTA
jgi:xanthine dehydrogenase accessory factor